MRKTTRIAMATVLMMLVSANIALADYAYSQVSVSVVTSKSFTVTLNGQAGTNSDPAIPGTATGVIWFNSSDGNTKNVNASVAGANQQAGAYPACATPIAVFKNTGTTTETLNIKLNSTVTGVVFFGNASFVSGSATGTPVTDITGIGVTGYDFVAGLGLNNQTALCIWANFTGANGGTSLTYFNYTSS
jgi:hypothetical protein